MTQADIYFDKDDLHGTQRLENFFTEFLLAKKVSGATAFKAAFGYGMSQHLKLPGLLFSFDDPPMKISFIDEDEKVKAIVAELRDEYKGGLIVTFPVQVW